MREKVSVFFIYSDGQEKNWTFFFSFSFLNVCSSVAAGIIIIFNSTL